MTDYEKLKRMFVKFILENDFVPRLSMTKEEREKMASDWLDERLKSTEGGL